MSVHIRVGSEPVDPGELRRLVKVEGCGSIVTFVGLTRGLENGIPVERLVFDSWEDELSIILERIANDAISSFGIFSVVIAHRTGSVCPGENIVCIHVGSAHREEGFSACSWLISELKKQAPLWKKEIREDGEHWKSGLG